MNKKYIVTLAAILVLLIAACDNKPVEQPLPEINDVNCQIEKIKQIQEKETRQVFTGLCSRRSGAITSTERPELA